MSENHDFLFLLAVSIVAGLVFVYLRTRLIRRTSTYTLYKVRSDLVLLVAKGILSEESPVFQHYYKRINFTLKEAPRVGFDDVLDVIIRHQKTGDFDKNMEIAEKTVKEMSTAVRTESDQVKTLIADYYIAQQKMLLSHSNFLRSIYLLIVKGWLPAKIRRILSPTYEHAIAYVQFTERSANLFR
jgi:hypothetical protein